MMQKINTVMMPHLAAEVWLEKEAAESVFWFKECGNARDVVEQQATQIRNLHATIDELRKDLKELGDKYVYELSRIDALGQFVSACRENGFTTSWNLAGMTEEGILEAVRDARKYKKPETVERSYLTHRGYLLPSGELLACNPRKAAGEDWRQVFTYDPPMQAGKAAKK